MRCCRRIHTLAGTVIRLADMLTYDLHLLIVNLRCIGIWQTIEHLFDRYLDRGFGLLILLPVDHQLFLLQGIQQIAIYLFKLLYFSGCQHPVGIVSWDQIGVSRLLSPPFLGIGNFLSLPLKITDVVSILYHTKFIVFFLCQFYGYFMRYCSRIRQ